MFEFIQRFFGKPSSSATAKERLRLVLLSDHLSLAPDVVEALKHDLVEVISRYVEVDAANCDVTFEQRETQVAMLANIPILGMRSRPAPPTAPPPAPPPPPAREPEPQPALDLGGATASVAAQPEPDVVTTAEQPAQPVARSNGSRKRRRKRPAGAALPSPG
ncbi:MAG TPA: cell division topological specificity factor MinE [Candidatus Elarobacter sp.]|nr:cell division topological specificity factor MinE [Candidatus Elarobacter sp.]